jgi:tol-pal system protein YbgF
MLGNLKKKLKMLKTKLIFSIISIFLIMVGCASNKLEKLEVDIAHLKKEVSALVSKDDELVKETNKLRLQLVELQRRLEQEGKERSKLEEQLFRLNLMLDEMGKKITSPEEEKLAPLKEKGGTAEEFYNNSYRLFSSGRYNEAEAGFVDFLKRFPESDLSDNAQYWIGEIYYLKRDFQRAIKEFSKVIEAYPFGNKVPDTYFKLGICHYNLRSYQQAIKFFEHTVGLFPHSEAASRAKRMLQELKSMK